MTYELLREATYKEPHYCEVPGGTTGHLAIKEFEGAVVKCLDCGRFLLCVDTGHGYLWRDITEFEASGLADGTMESGHFGQVIIKNRDAVALGKEFQARQDAKDVVKRQNQTFPRAPLDGQPLSR